MAQAVIYFPKPWSMPGVDITFDHRKLQGTASVDPLFKGLIHGDILLFVPFCWSELKSFTLWL
jgi:hypothetical protein